jgi:hypothetical protein
VPGFGNDIFQKESFLRTPLKRLNACPGFFRGALMWFFGKISGL